MPAKHFIHPTACLDESVEVGAGARIWHFCHIMSGARIGRDCVIGHGCFVGRGVVIGNGCKLQNHVSVFEGVELGDEVFVGPSAVFTNVMNPRAAISRKDEFRRTRVRRGATVGANATVLPGIVLGKHCFVGAGATVTRDVPPYALMVGVPARQTGWMSRAGERLTFDESGTARCPISRETYRLQDGRVERQE